MAKEAKGIYSFPDNIKQLYVCSDLEGNCPFRFNDRRGIVTLQDDTNIDENTLVINRSEISNVEKELNSNFTLENGIINNIISPGTALAYTGDLFDNGPYSLKLLTTMLNLKTTNRSRVILIGGNRDFNKLRLGIELAVNITKPNGTPYDLFTNSIHNLEEILDYTFTYKLKNVPPYLNHDQWKMSRTDPTLIYYYYSNNNVFNSYEVSETNDRFLKIANSFGMSEEKYYDEIRREFPSITDEEKIIKLTCLIFMLMCMDTSTIKIKFNNIVINNYIGKLFKYLKNIHTIAYFDIGEKDETSNTKNGLLSHAGVVDFTYPLGASPTIAPTKTNIIDMISNITIDKNSMLEEYSRFYNDKIKKSGDITLDNNIFLSESNLYNFVRYIGITAPPLQGVGPSPITQGIAASGIAPEKGYYKGGSNYEQLIQDITISSASDLTAVTENKIMYNIYGHQPQFFVPTVSNSQHTTNVALDICKTDFKDQFNNNNYSFSMLKLDKMGDDIIFGRSAIHFSKESKGYFYYSRVINDKLFKLPNKYINKNIFINGSPFFGIDTIKKQSLGSDSEKTLSNIESLKVELSKIEPLPVGGSKKKCKHVCGPLCKKCHKHDHQCMLKCHLCKEENCHKRRKTRKHRKPKKSRRQRRKSRKNTRKK